MNLKYLGLVKFNESIANACYQCNDCGETFSPLQFPIPETCQQALGSCRVSTL